MSEPFCDGILLVSVASISDLFYTGIIHVSDMLKPSLRIFETGLYYDESLEHW